MRTVSGIWAKEASKRLGRTIDFALRAEGPFFTEAEQAVINRKCGYAPGEWDGFQLNNINGVFHCTNGRKLDDPEIHAVMREAEPRIQRRVKAAMARPEVQAAISDVSAEATRRAMARLRERGFGSDR
jgi:hypothetical protein